MKTSIRWPMRPPMPWRAGQWTMPSWVSSALMTWRSFRESARKLRRSRTSQRERSRGRAPYRGLGALDCAADPSKNLPRTGVRRWPVSVASTNGGGAPWHGRARPKASGPSAGRGQGLPCPSGGAGPRSLERERAAVRERRRLLVVDATAKDASTMNDCPRRGRLLAATIITKRGGQMWVVVLAALVLPAVGCRETSEIPSAFPRGNPHALADKAVEGCSPGMVEGETVCAECIMDDEARSCRHLCERGNGNACSLMGAARSFGYAGPRSATMARAYNERGCALGSADACEALADCFASGDGCPKDRARALRMRMAMCHRGVGAACGSAGEMELSAHHEREGFDLMSQGCRLGAWRVCRRLARTCKLLSPADHGCEQRALDGACAVGDRASCVGGSSTSGAAVLTN